MDFALFKQAMKTRWAIFSAQLALLFGTPQRKRIAESQLKAFKRAKELESYRLKSASKDDLEKAKKLFFDYSCNQYFMIHDGVYEEFKRYGIRLEQEIAWRKEFISYWENRLSVDDLHPLDQLEHTNAVESIPSILTLADKGDGYAKLWYANALWKLCSLEKAPVELQKQGKQKSTELWQELSKQDIGEISENHKKKIMPFLFAMGASTPEEYVRTYAKKQLESNNPKPKALKQNAS
jgi:hypothetical protein